MPQHTHDGIDWVARLVDLREADRLVAPELNAVARRLVDTLSDAPEPAPHPTVIDVGCGAGGMSAALAAALAARGGGTLVLVDAVPELLAAAEEAVAAVGNSVLATTADRAGVDRAGAALGGVHLRVVRADLAEPGQFAGLPPADLVWASHVAHHLPDQRRAVESLAGLLAPGGLLALAEGGLTTRCLPWDVGVGEPGLQDRLAAAHSAWFRRMRADMPGVVRLPVGWNRVLADEGLAGVTAFSFVVDRPAPPSEATRTAVVNWLDWMARATDGLLDDEDAASVRRLLDPDDPAHVGTRDDVFLLRTDTVHTGRAPRTR